MKPSKVRRRLNDSLTGRRIVTAVRDSFEISLTDGFVIAMTEDWVVMHTLADGVYLDDIVMLRLGDISRVWFRDDDAYHHRAVEALDKSVAVFDCDDSVDACELLKVASATAEIFAVRLEMLDREPLAIGRLTRLRKKSFDLHYVGRDGVWANQVERWKYQDLTRIELGGRYLQALNSFSDPHPLAEEGS
ncbi:hypothetical protein [Cellulomonas sp. URHD0024]|uniref:hypothetical protein n=1 Tax=Cellulomonas sp. URHD0024 TaxID=1302620 RepID=UPI000485FAE3|nr:hypothetical protein [Cellulomonas sp. URHD0024]